MKYLDEKGRLFGKISIIDVLIIASALFAVIALIVNIIIPKSKVVDINLPVKYATELKAYNLSKTEIKPFRIGDKVYTVTGELVGKITNIEEKQGFVKEKLQDGSYVDMPSPEYTDYYLTVVGSGVLTPRGYKADDSLTLIPNESVRVATKFYFGNVVVLSVKNIDE